MNLKELRIGNLIKFENNEYTVISLNSETKKIHIKNESRKLSCNIHEITGISLTDEIIKSYGFKRDKFGFTNNSYFSIGKTLVYRIYFNDFEVTHRSVNCLHELQNIYFVLTGNELIR